MIIEKLLPQELEDEVHKVITSMFFNWNWNAENIIPTTPDEDIFQMTHVFFLKRAVWSPHYALVNSIIGYFVEKTGIKMKRVVRIKANLIPNIAHKPESLNNLIHTDVDLDKEGNFISLVYYVMDSDGDTLILEDDKETVRLTSSPIKGNCVWFDSKTYHRSCVPTHHKRRVVINFIVEVE
ncbi:hypothetical protein UFOVP118_69 [uncultured Caudovirales phage]|uniref:Prolyl 4-hydroxylase alpha subunit Fe(2+) 2OG dioxygenase domain-containing protein n=1 Tax=uncultured Caudovirales phage TaxID=2100421 RepID=A0A6J5L635_9CAUD|nr:hypothetical protein UFOVP118_69 [uncultured Caudovirales phage]